MVKNYYILYASPINQHIYEYFGGEILKNNGFKLKLLDLSPIIHPLLYKKLNNINDYKGEDLEVLFNKKEVLNLLSSLKGDSFVLNALSYNIDSSDFYRAISKSEAYHAIDVDVAVPISSEGETDKDILLRRIKRITIHKLIRYVKGTFKPALIKRFSRPPDFVISGGESSIKNMPNGHLVGKNTEILWTHTSDYNKYLEYKEKNEDTNYKPTAVFLCGSAPMFLRDNLAIGNTCPLTIDVYYPSLCRFFDRLESELGLTVEIAGHPGAFHPKKPDYFGGRLTLQGKTIEMVARSKLVLTHGSAACSFAVLFKKPIILFVTDQFPIEDQDMIERQSMASWLGTKLINIDKLLDRDWGKFFEINYKSYENYKQHFIKKDSSEELNSWQIVANRIKKI